MAGSFPLWTILLIECNLTHTQRIQPTSFPKPHSPWVYLLYYVFISWVLIYLAIWLRQVDEFPSIFLAGFLCASPGWTFQTLSHLLFTVALGRELFLPFSRKGNRGTERLRNLPTVTKLGNAEFGPRSQMLERLEKTPADPNQRRLVGGLLPSSPWPGGDPRGRGRQGGS